MPSQDDAFARHQQIRWLRADAARWVRPDAARFLKPGTRPEDVYPALALKYNPNQPRVPAGNGRESGRWSDGDGSGRPRVIIDTTDWGQADPTASTDDFPSFDASPMGTIGFGDVGSEIDSLNLFGMKPRERESNGVRLAGEPPRGIGDNGGPPFNEPPEIPDRMPGSTEQRMTFVRRAAEWLAHVGRRSPLASAFIEAADHVEAINRLTDMIRSANDPPQSLEDARDRAAGPESEVGYHDHHIVNQHDQNRAQFGNAKIDSYENKVRIPALRHLDLSGWYSRANPDFGGKSPRDYLRGKTWEEQMEVGLEELRKRGIIRR